MANLTSVHVTSGVPDTGTGDVATINALQADGGMVTIGAQADAKAATTDATPISAMSVWKQISASIQSAASLLTNNSFSAAVTLTRTADTNAYAANDVIGAATGSTAALTFASMGPSAGRIMITGAALEIDVVSVPAGSTNYNLYLYNVTPPSALGDNAAFDIPSGDRASFLGKISLGTPIDEGSTMYIETNGINKQVKLAGTSLFAYLVTVGAYTPTSAAVKVITLHSVAV